jgi:hypothetical protein
MKLTMSVCSDKDMDHAGFAGRIIIEGFLM